ncbi:MAG: aspartate 1-decarboxylase [Thermoguttaceae bacterium]|jgi:aspartate 1-decarboxylase
MGAILNGLDNHFLDNLAILAGRLGVQRFMLRSKIHRATLTGTDLDYEGSIAIDRELMDAADMLPGEQVHVLNLYNGQRLITYVIEAPAGSGTMLLNGPAARLGSPGDIVIVLAYCAVSDEEARKIKPIVVRVDAKNRIVS